MPSTSTGSSRDCYCLGTGLLVAGQSRFILNTRCIYIVAGSSNSQAWDLIICLIVKGPRFF
jgi:hypothetical protein